MYRLHITDFVPFYRAFRFDMEHGPLGTTPAGYESVAFFYHRDKEVLQLTDELDISRRACEEEHMYRVTGVVWEGYHNLPYEGNDQLPEDEGWLDFTGEELADDMAMMRELLATADYGRAWNGTCEFIVSCLPGNQGIKLRRRSHYGWPFVDGGESSDTVPDQRVVVSVDGEEVGVWHLPAHHFRNAWLEDDFEIPPEVTRGKEKITVRFESVGEAPWNDFHYWVFSYTV